MIKKGSTVDVHYVGKLSDGVVFDSSDGKEPLKFQVGSGQIIPGFEESLIGKKVGDKVTVTIQPEFAYGSVREDLMVKVPIDKMPGKVEVGQSLHAVGSNSQPIPVTVKEVNEDYVIIDGNHPLAGKELTFDIEIVAVHESNVTSN
jgi:FKBP-type peptidyl-prolyl cis-trans isomerase 2